MLDDLSGDYLRGFGNGGTRVIGEFGADHDRCVLILAGEVEADPAPGADTGIRLVGMDVVGSEIHNAHMIKGLSPSALGLRLPCASLSKKVCSSCKYSFTPGR